ncbi:thymidine kinase [Actinacidiphila glaucinigra]|uniref:Thymidine kinase n=1 Tax=Actinacidiphila glaucinigra TaxID=235986 RepID=A0A239F3K8_9ACTN|nr:thymidine kinase [Actinacidiphila glaucinigra]SNS50853.1 thymidine kinase [Actinacidiphila glaucinigra]
MLRFFAGPMGAGKSTLALQMAFNYRQAGREGLLLTGPSRDGRMSSRLGVAEEAFQITESSDLVGLLSGSGSFAVVDEAQFLTPRQVEQLAAVVDREGMAVDAFGLLTDFRSHLFPGSGRLVELADAVIRLQADVFCWCQRPGLINARIEGGRVARSGAQVQVGDVGSTYRVLCRLHWAQGIAEKGQ